jgi:hypothetical protein
VSKDIKGTVLIERGVKKMKHEFTDADREIEKAIRGMTEDERYEYIHREYPGRDRTPAGGAGTGREERGPENIAKCLKQLARETYYLWSFIWQKGLKEEAQEFIKDHKDEETPFERIRIDADCDLEAAIAFFL